MPTAPTGNHHLDTLHLWQAMGEVVTSERCAGVDRRGYPRFLTGAPACLVHQEATGTTIEATVRDVSVRGASLVADCPIPVDQVVTLTPVEPDCANASITAMVISCRALDAAYRLGLLFVGPT